MEKYIYFFGGGKADADKTMKELLGGKGANLAEMTSFGIPVPPGYTISTEVCAYVNKNNEYPKEMNSQMDEAIIKLEDLMGKKFGDSKDPLLVSVRSGAAVSMPGMMDTVLNLGLTDESVKALEAKNPRFAWDIYRRLISMYGDVVLDIEGHNFTQAIDKLKDKVGVEFDTDLTVDHLKELCDVFKGIIKEKSKQEFPQDPRLQLQNAIDAVFSSWNNDRAIKYRKMNNITGLLGTAVNVQAMVYGNMGDDCSTGVCFTRDPSTGENAAYGEYLINAQGEDVVAGIRTAKHLDKMGEEMPKLHKELLDTMTKLENHYNDMQDIEFTIQNNKLFILQTRTGKRTAKAAIKIAMDMLAACKITKKQAILRVDPNSLDQLLHPMFDPKEKAKAEVLTKGLPASPGAAMGQIVFTTPDAEKWAADGKKVILVRLETSPEDLGGMDAAVGVLTVRGGMTSHAAVVARGMGKCCVCGASALTIEGKTLKVGNKTFNEGDFISIDGSTGEFMAGEIKTTSAEISGDFKSFMELVDSTRRLGVRTNADNPRDAQKGRDFGAEGIGLCRTEHMFFEGDRIWAVREMIMADNLKDRKAAIAKLLPFQREDFDGIFRAMDGFPVTVRLLDPPLHEFVPHDETQLAQMAKILKIDIETVKVKVAKLQEINPMLGHRGCRLGITYPEITEMQARAIFEAACDVKKDGVDVKPEVMIPLTGTLAEVIHQKKIILAVADKVFAEKGIKVDYLAGTMIEIPRAALTADLIAQEAEFFSFGTNDLTQMTFGYSRDDAGVFIPEYRELGILPHDPFQVLDQEGVGQLVQMGLEKGRSTNPKLKVGICGEHGGEPASVKFCHRIGMDYVSCSPFRVPIARLAAAQAASEDCSGCCCK